MTEYETFMVYELDDSGERVKIDLPQEELQSNLHPEQVLVIIREDLRRIFIWKGPKSPVRKRFISSRVAQALQEELVKSANFHRCKIVSVDAGDEPTEFLNAFQLESMEVTEKLEDMRYVRNIERDSMTPAAVIRDVPASTTPNKEEEYYSPALQDTSGKTVASSISSKASAPRTVQKYPTKLPVKSSATISNEKLEEIKNKILDTDIPENYKRLNLIMGHTLYAAVSKIAKVFGDEVEETQWEAVKKVPKKMIELDNHVLRVYFGEKDAFVEAIEVLEVKSDSTGGTTPKISAPKNNPAPKKKSATKKKPAMTPMPQKPSSLKEKETAPKAPGRRQLPPPHGLRGHQQCERKFAVY